jgi:tRNA 2-thiouridine synthesizing protein C
MRSIFYLLDVAPYGCEKAFGLLNAAIVSIKMSVVVGLYADGVYLAMAGQNSKALGVPNLSDIIYAYPEIRIVAHEPSLIDRGLIDKGLIERIELVDEEMFLDEIQASDSFVWI